MQLAAHNGCSIRELGQRIPAREWPYFMALYAMEPWGFEADNYHAALISSTVANMAGQRLKRPVKVADYLTPKPLTPKQKAALQKAEARYGKSG